MHSLSLNGNWADLLIILFLLTYLKSNKETDFFWGLTELSTLIVSFVAALRYYKFFGNILITNFTLPQSISFALGFFIAGAVAQMILTSMVSTIYRRLHQPAHSEKLKSKFSEINSALSFLPSFFEGIIVTAFILTMLIALPVNGAIKSAILDSRIGTQMVSRTQIVETQLNTIFTPAISDTISFLTVNANPNSGDNVKLHFRQPNTVIDLTAEQTMFERLNAERASRGLKPLKASLELKNLARAYAKDMFTRGYFSHYNPEGESPFDRMAKENISYTAAGENLALAPNVKLAHQGLMNSPGHRANILSGDYGQIGIGVIDGGIYGEIFVQEFTN